MDYDKIEEQSQGVLIKNIQYFSLSDTLDNGQCFRWKAIQPNHYEGIAYGKYIELVQEGNDLHILHSSKDEFLKIWESYFDLTRDYEAIIASFSSDKTLKKATMFAPGLRVLHQEPWEALVSFILSQNNNIKRIKGIIERFCQEFGEPVRGGFAFPTPEKTASLSVEDLDVIRAGFRSKYVVDAAQKVADGTVSLTAPYTLPLEDARNHLMQIKGIGPKVADCVLLYGFHRIESLPIDVWMKRALEEYYPKGFPEKFSSVAGIAQQYIFHYARFGDTLEKKKGKS